ncbi:50S ribosomal protein L24 [Pleionea mediterranea]|jgi:large subunit ribosomal protein L24|uniref:Large ribosomal subunit protein uL24 n=1 Tax=Pleionea mediterranea TaxID=523701 RepID=A0A316FT53_9GAMM|nr:50S ribosomal protein L24 [Pleionea mediterranea]PWK51941.1 LSU ribosomal protein L24P [Pleionea mediterranea]
MRKIKSGDEVIVIAGKSKGQRGKVTKIMAENDKVIVEGANLVKKHQRANPQAGVEGGIVEKEAPLHISNVAIFNSATGKADRVGIKSAEDGKKERIFKSSGEKVDI